MGVSTDGQLCYGLQLDEIELPWDDHDEVSDWWLDVNNYVSPYPVYDSDGEYINGVEPPAEQIEAYWKHRRQWLEAHPLPFELVNYCSGDSPMYIMAVPGTLTEAHRGCPQLINAPEICRPHDMTAILQFCQQHSIPHDASNIGWYLSSYWG